MRVRELSGFHWSTVPISAELWLEPQCSLLARPLPEKSTPGAQLLSPCLAEAGSLALLRQISLWASVLRLPKALDGQDNQLPLPGFTPWIAPSRARIIKQLQYLVTQIKKKKFCFIGGGSGKLSVLKCCNILVGCLAYILEVFVCFSLFSIRDHKVTAKLFYFTNLATPKKLPIL